MQFILTHRRSVADGVTRWTLRGDTRAFTRPGQFAQVQTPGFFLRRPISVCDWKSAEDGELALVFKAVGHGTRAMQAYPVGTQLDLLTGLGNGFTLAPILAAKRPLLVGGGVGTPPMIGLCRALIAAGARPAVVLGFGAAKDAFGQDEFAAMGAEVRVATVDGSLGTRGFVTDAMGDMPFDYVCACGPEPMLRAVWQRADAAGAGGQFSFESRMACGFGACMGCTCHTLAGSKRICKDGPVLLKEEIAW